MANKAQLDIAIIGAGPYGLSIGAHLQDAGIQYRIFGHPMESWRRHTPPGMRLKSYGESSNLFDAHAEFTLETFTRAQRIPYHPSHYPVERPTFIAYGDAFQQRYVPHLTRARLISHRVDPQGHELRFDSGETVLARRVVMAVGGLAFKYIPPLLSDLPAELMSHSSAYGPLEALAGKRVIIIGGGASALDLAALLSQQDCAVTIVARAMELRFQSRPKPTRSSLHRAIVPEGGLGAGWLLRACTTPQLVRLLPDHLRVAVLSNTFGPSGGYFVRKHVETRVRVKLGRDIEQVRQIGDRVHLRIVDREGFQTTVAGDHVIAATGYRIDLRRLPFLDDETLQRLRMIDCMPPLSAQFESSVPGLFFVGLASGRTFGPITRFIAGAIHPARRLTQAVLGTPGWHQARSRSFGPRRVATATVDTPVSIRDAAIANAARAARLLQSAQYK
jgi:thioredoxin reductase